MFEDSSLFFWYRVVHKNLLQQTGVSRLAAAAWTNVFFFLFVGSSFGMCEAYDLLGFRLACCEHERYEFTFSSTVISYRIASWSC